MVTEADIQLLKLRISEREIFDCRLAEAKKAGGEIEASLGF